MGFRFFKRMNILPGVQLNLSKGGGSVSVGPQGAKFTIGTSGARVTFGVPGTGLFYTTDFSFKKLGKLFGRSADAEAQGASDAAPQMGGKPDSLGSHSPRSRSQSRSLLNKTNYLQTSLST